MKTVLIGSSNVYRFLKLTKKETQNSVNLQKCTKVSGFLVHMENLEESDEHVVITVIENFMCDAVGDTTVQSKIERIIGEVLDAFVETVMRTSMRLPKTKFVLIEPMARTAVPWYTDGLSAITTEYSKRLYGLQLPGISVVKRCDHPKQVWQSN